MARRRRRKPPSSPPQPPRNDRFHTPFGELKGLLRNVGNAPPAAATPAPASQSESNKADSKPQASSNRQARQEQAVFLAEMAGVKPLQRDRRGFVEKPTWSTRRRQEGRDEPEALIDLRQLVEGRGTFTIQHTDEYMEGVAPDVDQRLAQRLHRGDFSVQAHLDLHGYTVDEAKEAVNRFLTSAYSSGQRCVRLVHGRGHNSRDNRPVLKEQVQIWLSYGRLSRLVLAFATAPSVDGGAGAVYVLLRRRPYPPRRTS